VNVAIAPNRHTDKTLRALCACVLLIILTAGLWPFHAPGNEVTWSNQDTGLLFGKHGSVLSASSFESSAVKPNNSCSLDIWLKPSQVDAGGGMILAFYWPDSNLVPFSLRQYRAGLVLGSESQKSSLRNAEIYVGDILSSARPVLVTITSSESGTAIYADGALRKRVPNFVLSSRDLTGQLLIGSAPSTSYNWSGELKGLAVYDHQLSPAEVSNQLAVWTGAASVRASSSQGVIARYVFDEGKGSVVHNLADSATDLLIPERFFVLHPQFLERPWDEYHPGWRYWKNVGINIVGFIPLGFFFRPYFGRILNSKRSSWLVIAFGFAVSLTIEVGQSFLPTRDSGMTDLITNTFGTALGVMLYLWVKRRNWLVRTRIAPTLPLEEDVYSNR